MDFKCDHLKLPPPPPSRIETSQGEFFGLQILQPQRTSPYPPSLKLLMENFDIAKTSRCTLEGYRLVHREAHIVMHSYVFLDSELYSVASCNNDNDDDDRSGGIGPVLHVACYSWMGCLEWLFVMH